MSLWYLPFFPPSFLFSKSLERYYIFKALSDYNFSPLNLHSISGKKKVPHFPPHAAAGNKSVAKEVGHGETEHLEIHVFKTLEFFQYILNKVSFSGIVQ